jgi:cytochrome c oxidase subunit 2
MAGDESLTMPFNRRQWLKAATLIAAAPVAGAALTDPPTVVKMTAQRFHYTPSEIPLKAGESYVLEVTSLDFTHGFNLPDLKTRADLIAGMVTRIPLKFDKPGTYDFLCDNFCGDGHEEMNGRFIVKA